MMSAETVVRTQSSALSPQSLMPAGITIAHSARMARRLTALLGIAIIVGLVLTLFWRVYEHRQSGGALSEPAIVRVQAEKFADRAT
jgi:hypothetical protein